MIYRSRHRRPDFSWLELLLAVALVMLALQLWPAAGQAILGWLDVRRWSLAVRIAVNVGVLALLLAVRFGPQLWRDWLDRRREAAARRARREETQQRKAELKAIEQMQESRGRRLY